MYCIDLYMTMDRLQVPIRRQAKHLDHSQNTQRLLASLEDNKSRQKLSLALFRYYWQDDGDIENLQVFKTTRYHDLQS